MIGKMLRTFALLLSMTLSSVHADEVSLALDAGLSGQDDVYTIELVLFRQANARLNEEFWPNEQTAPDYTNAGVPLNHNGMPLSSREGLAQTSFALNGEVNRLTRNGYEILYHNSWVETFPPNSRSKIRVGDPMGSFEGTVLIERRRFLHIYPDINYYLASGPEQVAPVVKMNETRRMRSSELHYIDHPVLGMLVLFRPVKSD